MLRILVLSLPLLLSTVAHARAYDVSLSDLRSSDEAVYRGIAREMGLVLAPIHLGPARTTGHSGFEYSLRVSSHNIHQNQSYWQRTLSLGSAVNVPDTLRTTSLSVRKGLPFGIELGSNITWLENSETLAIGARVRVGLLEGYQSSYAPDISVHAGVNRMLGSTDLDLATIVAGASVSYRIATAGKAVISPYAGFDLLMVQAGSHLLLNPDHEPGGRFPNLVFQSLDLDDPENQWSRVRYGLRVETFLLAVTVQHDMPVGESAGPDQNVISVGLSSHF